MFKKLLLAGTVCTSMLFSSCDTLSTIAKNADLGALGNTGALSTAQIAEALKEALNQGVTKGVLSLNKTDGFFKDAAVKILFPSEVKVVENKLRDLGLGNLADEAILKMNRAAEDAAGGAKDIFINAIKSMTITDAMNILMGDKTACTEYLKKTSSSQLYAKMQPVVHASLNKVGALNVWTNVVTRYNQIPLVSKVNPNLDDHITNKTMDGIFAKVAAEEQNIRTNPTVRATDLMKKVFAKQDK